MSDAETPAPSPSPSIGVDLTCVPDLKAALQQAVSQSFDFVAAPLVHPRFRRDDIGVSAARTGPFTRSDMVLTSRHWTTSVVGKVSTWLNLDSTATPIRRASEKAFKQELNWASHLGVPAVLCPTPEFDCFNYASFLNQYLEASNFLHVWIRVPLVYNRTMLATAEEGDGSGAGASAVPGAGAGAGAGAGFGAGGSGGKDRDDPWEAWNNLRSACEYSPNMSVLLELTADLPDEEALSRWLAEPVKAAVIPTSVFMTSRKGYPALPRGHQEFIKRLFKHNVQFLLRGRGRKSDGLKPYLTYLTHVLETAPLTEEEEFEAPYYDYLQAPLQPLMDNLESQTYETFERDPIKYQQYLKAIEAALLDTPVGKESVVMVVGAGRGPLVRRALLAASRAMRTIRVWAVEKNPNAVVTLRNMVLSEGLSNVTVVASDMRKWDAPEKADILVSELLGSFGDNELSPECLDGVQRFLKDDGISIPYDYTSFMAPVMTTKLWNDVKSQKELKKFETPYVVRLFQFKQLAKAQPCFTFVHPNKDATIDNTRYCRNRFTSSCAAVMHGFAGYFEAGLYKKKSGEVISISINPETFSDGMFSWFPLYIPLRTPQYVAAGATIETHLWRHVNPSKVWYEWATASPEVSPVHNPIGRSYWIGL